ncbi:MAG: NAD(P)-binding protein, partial [Acidimicrobiales bacterium]
MKKAIVVGSGPAGSTIARLLARSGDFEVVVLEKGRNHLIGLGGVTAQVSSEYANDELGYESRLSPIEQDPLLEPRSFRTSPGTDRTFVGRVNNLPTTVGGGTTHYDAKARRFREVDFNTNSLMGGTPDKPAIPGTTYADWPMQYRHLEPFYAVMEEIVGVQGPARRAKNGRVLNPNPYESYRSTPYPMPPGVGQLNSILPAESARRLGYHPAAVPTSVNSRPYRDRPACVDCAFCLHYGCPINAKGGGV